MKNYLFFLATTCMALTACNSLNTLSGNSSDAALYQEAIVNAMSPEPNKIHSNLVPITRTNSDLEWKTIDGEEYLLVVSWKSDVSFYKPYLNPDSTFYPTQGYPIWITTAPQLLHFMQSENFKDPNKRLLQLLGLPPDATYNYFVEFWVKPSDLFRPCPDAEITDQTCALCFPAGSTQSHEDWINANRISRYYPTKVCTLYNKYPWTQLGYTYDWNPENEDHVGMSEFVIATNSFIKVNAIYTTAAYLQK